MTFTLAVHEKPSPRRKRHSFRSSDWDTGLSYVAEIFWHAVFGLALIPILMTLILFVLFAKDSPSQPAPKPLSAYAAVLGMKDNPIRPCLRCGLRSCDTFHRPQR